MARRAKAAPVAFVSYSWDNTPHKTWVRNFASQLVALGIDVILDQWHLEPGQSLTQFMETSIESAEFVLVICTPKYALKSNARQGGVGYEQQIVSGHIAQGLKTKRFVPVLRRGSLKPGLDCAVPTHLSGLNAVDLRRSGSAPEEMETLVRAIFAQPRYQPPELGQALKRIKSGPKRKRRPKSTAIRLPESELDGYSLRSGVASAELHPKTFYMPTEARRARLAKGDLVKVIFQYPEDVAEEFDGMSGERMWVKVTGNKGRYLSGKLMNQPLGQDNSGWPLIFGDRVLFLPEHVIDIEA